MSNVDQSWVFDMLPLSTEQRQELISELQTDSMHVDNMTENQSAGEQRCSEAAPIEQKHLEEPNQL